MLGKNDKQRGMSDKRACANWVRNWKQAVEIMNGEGTSVCGSGHTDQRWPRWDSVEFANTCSLKMLCAPSLSKFITTHLAGTCAVCTSSCCEELLSLQLLLILHKHKPPAVAAGSESMSLSRNYKGTIGVGKLQSSSSLWQMA